MATDASSMVHDPPHSPQLHVLRVNTTKGRHSRVLGDELKTMTFYWNRPQSLPRRISPRQGSGRENVAECVKIGQMFSKSKISKHGIHPSFYLMVHLNIKKASHHSSSWIWLLINIRAEASQSRANEVPPLLHIWKGCSLYKRNTTLVLNNINNVSHKSASCCVFLTAVTLFFRSSKEK